LCVCAFFSKIFAQSSLFIESRLCTRPLFSHFVTNLDWLAGQPIQIFFAVQTSFCFGQDFLCIPPWGQSCGRQLHDDKGVIAVRWLAQWQHPGDDDVPHRDCLCWIDDAHHPPLSLLSSYHLVSSLPLSPLMSSSLFGIIVAIVAIVASVTVVAIVAVALFAPVTISLATIVVTLAVVAAWFLTSLLPFGVIVAVVAVVAIFAIVAILAVLAVALFAPVVVALVAIVIALAVVAATALTVATALVLS
jgi:hypothetical protein